MSFEEENINVAFSEEIKKMAFEMKIVGFVNLFYGIFISLSLLLLPFGLPLMIAGKRLVDSASSLKNFAESNSIDDIKISLLFMRTYFRILFWMIVVFVSSFVLITYFIFRQFEPLFDMLLNLYRNTPIFS
jgi:hypothetical protein